MPRATRPSRPGRTPCCRTPSPGRSATRSSRSTTTWSSRPTCSRGGCPARLADRAPRVVENRRGHQLWEFDGQRYTQVGMNAVAGRRPECVTLEPTRFEDMRRGCWDIDARIADMDINGVWASLNFPSQITGFSGRVFSRRRGPRAGAGGHPGLERLALRGVVAALPRPHHPLRHHLPGRPRAGAAEIRRNAERGFRSVTLPERPAPHRPALDLLGVLGPHHRRLRGDRARSSRSTSAPRACPTCRRTAPGGAGGHPVRPDVADGLRRVAVVGPAGAVPRAQDRHERGRHRLGGHAARPARQHRGPLGLRPRLRRRRACARPTCCQRNFWFCTIDDPSTIDTRHRIGIDHIMVEVDYPHGDSTWPDTQDVIEQLLGPPAGRASSASSPTRTPPALPLAAPDETLP